MIERYRPEQFRAVAAFARRLDNFFYVKMIIDAHTRRGVPGSCWVWREDGRVAAFAAVAFLNADDAWLWGMRVDPAFQNRGIATRFTRAQFKVARDAGRTWAGLNTLDRKGKAPTFRVMEKLGMRLEDTYATDVYWRRPKGVIRPRVRRHPDVFALCRESGMKTVFFQHDGWFYTRLMTEHRPSVNEAGFVLDGTPLLYSRRQRQEKGRRFTEVIVNLFAPSPHFRSFVPRLLALVPRRGQLVVNYPVGWAGEFRRAARKAVPNLRQNRGCWFSAWRVYGKVLRKGRSQKA